MVILVDELQLGSGSEIGLKEFGAKVREGFGEKWVTLVDAAGVRRSRYARKAFILVSALLEDTRGRSRSPGRCVYYQP